MRTKLDITLLSLAIASSAVVAITPAESELNNLYRRALISDSEVKESYDYVIAGGGLAGLVLASRLTENPSLSVLVLEAGKSGDQVKDRINEPAGAYYSSIVGTEYDWQHVTVPQPHLNNRVISWPRGKILGGSSAMNAMYLVRPSSIEMNAWQEIIGSPNWGWDQMYQYMKKAENFTAPSPDILEVVNIKYDASTHGSGGPMQISYPGVMINLVSNWTRSCSIAGMPEQTSPNGGVTLGGFITPSSINPANWTRSYSRSAYIDSLPPRPNLHILPESTVVRLVLSDKTDSSGNYAAKGVEYASNASSKRTQVGVKREAILAGGALGSPKVLMLSGVGPKDVLNKASVNVKVELPGVGQRLQDHLTAPVVWQTPLETAGNIHDSGSDFSKSAPFLSFINDAVAFANISLLFPAANSSAVFQKEIQTALDNSTLVNSLVPSQDDSVKAGYKKIYQVAAGNFWNNGVAQLEMLMSVISPGQVSIQSAMQHPYSIGRAWINSTNPFDPIVIDPQYYSHPADIVIMRQGIKLVRQVGIAYGTAFGQEISPGPGVQTDDDIDAWLVREGANTQYHPTGTCTMLPKDEGGVVDKDLRVYGLANVRVVDASVFPFEFAAHLASTTYGVAEQAADLIKSNSYVVEASSTANAKLHGMPLSLASALVGAVVLYLGL